MEMPLPSQSMRRRKSNTQPRNPVIPPKTTYSARSAPMRAHSRPSATSPPFMLAGELTELAVTVASPLLTSLVGGISWFMFPHQPCHCHFHSLRCPNVPCGYNLMPRGFQQHGKRRGGIHIVFDDEHTQLPVWHFDRSV